MDTRFRRVFIVHCFIKIERSVSLTKPSQDTNLRLLSGDMPERAFRLMKLIAKFEMFRRISVSQRIRNRPCTKFPLQHTLPRPVVPINQPSSIKHFARMQINCLRRDLVVVVRNE